MWLTEKQDLKTECALPCNKTICINYEKQTEYFFWSNLLDRQAVAFAMSKKLVTNRENLDLVMDHFLLNKFALKCLFYCLENNQSQTYCMETWPTAAADYLFKNKLTYSIC